MLVTLCFEKAKLEEGLPLYLNYFNNAVFTVLGINAGMIAMVLPSPHSKALAVLFIFSVIALTVTVAEESCTEEGCCNLNNMEGYELNGLTGNNSDKCALNITD